MVVFTNPGFVVQTLCFKSHLAFFACMVGEGIYICGIMCYIILPRLIASTPPPIRGVGGTWALAHFIIAGKSIPLK